MKRAVLSLKGASSPETTLFCLSNSNTVYIDVILKHHKLTDLFTRVTTNPSYWTEDDKLIISRRVAPDAPKQHGCKVGCSENMCKGQSLIHLLGYRERPRRSDDVKAAGVASDGDTRLDEHDLTNPRPRWID